MNFNSSRFDYFLKISFSILFALLPFVRLHKNEGNLNKVKRKIKEDLKVIGEKCNSRLISEIFFLVKGIQSMRCAQNREKLSMIKKYLRNYITYKDGKYFKYMIY